MRTLQRPLFYLTWSTVSGQLSFHVLHGSHFSHFSSRAKRVTFIKVQSHTRKKNSPKWAPKSQIKECGFGAAKLRSCTVRPSGVRPRKNMTLQIEAYKADPSFEMDFWKSDHFLMDLWLDSVDFSRHFYAPLWVTMRQTLKDLFFLINYQYTLLNMLHFFHIIFRSDVNTFEWKCVHFCIPHNILL